MDTLRSFGKVGFNLIKFVDRKIFLANVLKQKSWIWRAESKTFAFGMMYEMNYSEKERSLIRTTENLLCCFCTVLLLYYSFLIKVMRAVAVHCQSFQVQGFI